MSGAGAGFGSFMEGMQGGLQTMDQLKDSRLKRKLYDQAVTEAEAGFEGQDFSRARLGLPAIKRSRSSDTLIGMLGDKMDPVLARWMEKLGRGTGATESPTADALQVSEELQPAIPEFNPESVEAPSYEFADGTAGGLGDWLDDEKAGKPKRDGYSADSKAEVEARAERARRASSGAPRQAIPEQVIDRSGDKTMGQKVAGKAKAAAKYEGYGLASKPGSGMLSRAGRFVGRAAAPLAIGGAAAGGIRGALDAETTGEGILSDMGQRAVGAGKGVVAGLLDPVGAIIGRDGEEAPAPTPEAAPQQALPVGGSSGPSNPRRYSGQSRSSTAVPGAAKSAIPEAAPAATDPMAGFDITKFKAAEIPNFSNQDWVAHREDLMKDLVMNGMSYAEAWDKVDQQVVATQQRGFMHFAQQAYAALSTSGKGSPQAAAAVRAAFQYLPSTTDIQVGEYNGHLVAFGVDEDTGEQVGTPIVITPELLQGVMVNFSDPKAWAEHAQDNRKLDQADRELGQGDKRLNIMERANEIDAFGAQTARMDAVSGGGSGGADDGMKRSDSARNRTALENGAFEITQDATERSMLIAVMAEMDRADGGFNPEKVVAEIKQLAQTPEGMARIRKAYQTLTGR